MPIRPDGWVAERVVAVGRSDDRPALASDTAHCIACERDDAAVRIVLGREDSGEPIANAVALPPAVKRRQDGRPNDSVQAGGIAAAGAERDTERGSRFMVAHNRPQSVYLLARCRLQAYTDRGLLSGKR